jgi:hypothetical protein
MILIQSSADTKLKGTQLMLDSPVTTAAGNVGIGTSTPGYRRTSGGKVEIPPKPWPAPASPSS